jgi:hypothetical protein
LRAGAVIGGLNQRKGNIADTEIRDDEFTLVAEVGLNDMFGCMSFFFSFCPCAIAFPDSHHADATQLRGMTQGKGKKECPPYEFSM